MVLPVSPAPHSNHTFALGSMLSYWSCATTAKMAGPADPSAGMSQAITVPQTVDPIFIPTELWARAAGPGRKLTLWTRCIPPASMITVAPWASVVVMVAVNDPSLPVVPVPLAGTRTSLLLSTSPITLKFTVALAMGFPFASLSTTLIFTPWAGSTTTLGGLVPSAPVTASTETAVGSVVEVQLVVTVAEQATGAESATKITDPFLVSVTPVLAALLLNAPATTVMFLGSALVLVSLPVAWPTELVESDGWVSVLAVPSTGKRTPRLESGLPSAALGLTGI